MPRKNNQPAPHRKIVLFHPYIPKSAIVAVKKTLNSRWIGQGPKVAEFEKLWEEKISSPHKAVAVGSGTDALHLAYILAGIKEGDEVISPVFTCAATNMPLLWQRAKIVFADIKKDSLNVDPEDISRKITPRTKAIVVVHYGGTPCDMDEIQAIADKHKIPIIEDAAQAHGSIYKNKKIGSISDFTCFSFQALKLINTADGGMLTVKNPEFEKKARRIRWFGIDRDAKMKNRWNDDITEIGYKYQMTDVAAAMGITALKEFNRTLKHYLELVDIYKKELKGMKEVAYAGGPWLCTVLTEKSKEIKAKLAEKGIESNQVHYRNDRYSIFGGRVNNCPNMDALENKYLVLPQHYHLEAKSIEYICSIIRKICR
jgi:perosamine synthetase